MIRLVFPSMIRLAHQRQRVYLRLCAPCKARMFDPHVHPSDAVHSLCEDCAAKVAQCVRLLTSDDLNAVVDIP